MTWIIAKFYLLLTNPLDSDSNTTAYQKIIAPAFDRSAGGSITLEAHLFLPFRNLWTYIVLAYGCDDHPIIQTAQISTIIRANLISLLLIPFTSGTYDIQNVSITSPFPGQIRVTFDFINGSTASGVLTIAYSLINNSVVLYSLASMHSTEQKIEDVISDSELPTGLYGVSVFVVNESGFPFPRVAATPVMVHVHFVGYKPTNDHQLAIMYDLDPTSTGVCIICTFLDSSTTDCVAVVHQQISQLSSSGLMNIESSHKFNRSGDTAYGCIEGINLTLNQIGIIEGVKRTNSDSSMSIKLCKH